MILPARSALIAHDSGIRRAVGDARRVREWRSALIGETEASCPVLRGILTSRARKCLTRIVGLGQYPRVVRESRIWTDCVSRSFAGAIEVPITPA